MTRYKFRLETLQKVRKAKRDEARVALAEAFRAEQVLTDHQAELAAEQSLLREVQRSAAAGRYLDINQLLEAQRYDLLLKIRSQELAKQTLLLAAETVRRRQSLVEADRDVRVLELLDERKWRDHQSTHARLQVKQLDEIASAQWHRK